MHAPRLCDVGPHMRVTRHECVCAGRVRTHMGSAGMGVNQDACASTCACEHTCVYRCVRACMRAHMDSDTVTGGFVRVHACARARKHGQAGVQMPAAGDVQPTQATRSGRTMDLRALVDLGAGMETRNNDEKGEQRVVRASSRVQACVQDGQHARVGVQACTVHAHMCGHA